MTSGSGMNDIDKAADGGTELHTLDRNRSVRSEIRWAIAVERNMNNCSDERYLEKASIRITNQSLFLLSVYRTYVLISSKNLL